MGVAISKQDAVVTNLVGQLKAKDENGNIRDLSIGDLIRNGEEIIFTANDTFTIEYADGTRLTEQNAQPSAQPQPDTAAADVAQFANSGVDAEIAALQAQILAGDDPTANLPATAAGAGTAGNQGDFGYVAVDRDGSELLASAGYDTSGFDQTAITTQEEILLEDLPLTGPTLTSSAATLSDANLPTGTTPSPAALTQTGNLSFSAAAGVASLTLDGVAIVSGGVFNGPVSINTEYGVLTINAIDLINGNISYSFTLNSAVDHSSSDDFSQAFNLILTDLEGNSVGNTLTISVLDDTPSGQDDVNSVDEDSLLAISGNLLDNDVQGGDTAQVTAAGSGGNLDNAVSNQSQVSGSYGLLTLNADGSYNYQINSAAQAVQALAQGESLTEVFSYLLTDADGDTSVQTLTITITGTNDVPVISTPQPGEADGAVREAGQFDDGSIDPGTPGVSGQLSASDVDNGAVLIWSGSADSPLGSFSVDAATGAWNYQLDNAAADGLLEGEIRTETFSVTVTDELGASAEQLVTITIIGTNDAPILSADSSGSITEDVDVINGILSDSGSLSFTDVDIGDSHVVNSSYNGDVSWSGGALDQATQDALAAGFSADNSGWSYDIANSLVQFLAVGETITLSFTLTVTDAFGATDSQLVTLTITGTNDGPIINPPGEGDADGTVREAGQFDDSSVDPGTPGVSGQLSASDVDNGADLTWSGSADSPLGSFSVDAATGAWNYQLDNAAVDGLLEGEIRTETFTVTVTDEYGASAEQLVTITIIGTNDAPILSADASGAFIEDLDVINGMLSDSGSLSFTDVDIGDSHVVSSSYNGDASWSGGALDQATQDALAAGFSADNSGWSYDIANSLVQFLAVGETITLSFTLTVTDAFGASDSQPVTLTITGTNDAPVLSIDMSGAVTEDVDVVAGMLSDSGVLSFTDVDINDSHSVGSSYNGDVLWSGGALDQATQDALAAGFSVDNSGWIYDIANSLVQFLAVGETITLSFDVTVDDGNGGTDTETVTITINGTNDPVEGEFAKEIWVPASLLQLSDPYLAGYPLNIDVPTDVDATDDISITNLSLEFIDPGETAEIGSIWYWDEDIQMLVQYDFNNPEALSATELGSLVYMPGDNGDIEEQLDISLTFTVNSGTDQVDGDFIIHAVPGNSLGGESVTIGDGSSPLTSGNDQDAVLSISGGFADAINLDPANGSLDLFTDYQKSPFAIPIPGDERDIDTTAGSKRETEVSVRLTINGITFIVLLADPVDSVEQTWFYDADSGLMKASIGYDQIVQESDNSVTLADYLTLNPAQAGDLWTITYFDNDGGSYQARYVQAVFTHELLPDDAITVTGTDDIDNLIFGSTQSDSLTGANQSDEIVGREGNDTIYGLEGDDQLLGGAGNDYIFGGTGADYLVGGPGSDRLDAGIDNDRDILIWDAGSADGSTDEVYNFDPNTDALDLSDILVNEENGVLDDYLDFSFVGGNTIISVDTTGAGGDSVTIVLNGVDLSTEYGTTDEGVIIQSLISDGALLVTQPVVQASLPEPNYTYSSEEQLIP
ncbi:retention module-containing protein [Shewanella algae]